ncbi:PLP-dependent aminotransferase family protein [Williamsia herbipolensis]|uniref:PLP-dependent aminotransferase family protein n=1 Tax=Williamsia herbipolensis TaxID=1603258 RepID=A0AAU4K2D8_9NOCA|nr:PLP-dependent aminotransferase family protein [Williamsia herbipolensis]
MPSSSSLVSPPVHPSRSAAAVPGSAIRDLLRLTETPAVLSMAGGLPATELIPAQRIADATAAAVGDRDLLQYTASAGLRRTRESIARHEAVAPEQVLVTHGSQQALSLLAAALVDPGDVVVVDDPVYVGAMQVFASVGADIRGLPLTEKGIDVSLLARWCADGLRPTIVHTVTAFHNPGGVSADAARRRDLAELADRHGFWVIDDDPYGRLRFRGDVPAPTRSFGDRVITLGSASKILAPALRVGWLIAPPQVVALVERLRQSADLCGSALCQAVVGDLLDDTDWLSAHIAAVAGAYSRRAHALVAALDDVFGEAIETSVPDGGMFCWARLPGVDTTALLDAAVGHGVAYVPGQAFSVRRDLSDRLRLSFATLTEDQLRTAAGRLHAATAAG